MFEIDKEAGTIHAYGIVADESWFEDAFDARDFKRGLTELRGSKEVTIHLMSNGGEVATGTSIANQIRAFAGKTTVVIDSMAASIASVIAASADEVLIYDNAYMMTHNPWTLAMGDASELREVADLLDKFGDSIAGVYARKTGMKKEEWLDIMQEDRYFNGEEAVEIGLADSLVETREKEPVARLAPVAMATAMPRVAMAQNRLKLQKIRRRAN